MGENSTGKKEAGAISGSSISWMLVDTRKCASRQLSIAVSWTAIENVFA